MNILLGFAKISCVMIGCRVGKKEILKCVVVTGVVLLAIVFVDVYII